MYCVTRGPSHGTQFGRQYFVLKEYLVLVFLNTMMAEYLVFSIYLKYFKVQYLCYSQNTFLLIID